MKVSYDEGIASHVGPESCVGGRKVTVEALTGERVGWVLSREMAKIRSADNVCPLEGNTGRVAKQDLPDSARSETPRTHRSISRGSRETPGSAGPRGPVRAVNPKGARRR
jgi:RNA-directed DNA polymerase